MLKRFLPLAAIAAMTLPTAAYALQIKQDPPDPTPTPTPVATPSPTPTPTPVATPAPTPTPTPAAPPTLNLSTGLNASGNLQTTNGAADAYWSISSQAAQVSAPGSASYFPMWVGPDTQSSWIVANASTSAQPAAPYTFSRLFSLAGLDLSTVTVSGQWTGDDSVTLALNGFTIGSVNDPDYTSFHDFVAPASDLLQGDNTLTATMDASDQNTDGFRLEGAAIQNADAGAVPEPVSIALLGTALTGIALTRRRNA